MSNYNGYNNYDPNNYNNYNYSNNNNRKHRGSNIVVILSVALVMLMLGGLIGVVVMQYKNGGNDTETQMENTRQTETQPNGENDQNPQKGGFEVPQQEQKDEEEDSISEPLEPAKRDTVTQNTTYTGNGSLGSLSNQIANVVESVSDSVVGIHNYQMVSNSYSSGGSYGYYYYFSNPYGSYGNDQNRQEAEPVEQLYGSGSGVIYSSNGYVITNYHVVEDADRVTVVFSDGSEEDAEVIGYDSVQDIALLKIDRNDLVAARIGDSTSVRTGEFAIAIGSPLGDELAGTTTFGMISYASRTLEIDGAYVNMIQTDAAINSGNSGGALLNVDGEVIGINTRKTSGSTTSGSSIEGIGFAIPINEAVKTVEELIATGTIARPGLGITGQEITESMASYYNLEPGIYVTSVSEGGAAEKAGMKQQDIITAIDGREITTYSGMRSILYSYKIGDTVTVSVYRAGEHLELNVTLEELKQE